VDFLITLSLRAGFLLFIRLPHAVYRALDRVCTRGFSPALLLACSTVMLVASLCVVAAAWSDSGGERPGSVQKNVKKGWWWYEDPAPPEEVMPKEVPVPQRQGLVLKSDEEMMQMHPDDLKIYGEAMLKRAVQAPTIDRVREYYEVQDVMRRKALAFANVTAAVMRMNPEASWEADISPAGKRVDIQQREKNIRDGLGAGRNDFALLYFYEEGCPYCVMQANTIERLEQETGWVVRRLPLSQNRVAADKFGVEKVPYMMLIWKYSRDYFPIGYGVISLARTKKNIYQGMRYLKGEVTPDQFLNYEKDMGTSFDPTVNFDYRKIGN